MTYQQIKTIVFNILAKEGPMTYEEQLFLNEYATYEIILDYIETTGEGIDVDSLLDDINTFQISALDLIKF